MKPWSALLLIFVSVQATAHGEWIMAPESTLTFSASYDQEPFFGRFKSFAVHVQFDPKAPEQARLSVTVEVASLDTDNEDRDETLANDDWFDFVRFPQARFTAAGFRSLGGNRYSATGTLDLKGIVHQQPITFRWITDTKNAAHIQGTAEMTGNTVVDRLLFGIGSGDWADTDLIGAKVAVDFDVHLAAMPYNPGTK